MRHQWDQAMRYRMNLLKMLTAIESNTHDGQRGDLAAAYGGLSWTEVQAGRFEDAIKDAKEGLSQDPSATWILVNEAHGLLFSGHAGEARDLYFKIKDYPRGDGTLANDIEEDFQTLCNLGYVRPEMSGIARGIGINNSALSKCLADATK
jgi:tetratricopeptide (TPR) repeat protein